MSSLRVAVDIGGTFTDVVVVGGDLVHSVKTPTVPDDLTAGVRLGVAEVLRKAGARPSLVERFIHGTTIATNAVLEEKGSTTALLTTAGFEDVLEIGRLQRSRLYDPFMDTETPIFLAPRHRRYGVRERIDSQGRIVEGLDDQSVVAAVTDAVSKGAKAFAVCYLFSFMNPIHEERTFELLSRLAPSASVSISSQVHPVFREYERTVLTTFDAFIRPTISRYIAELQQELERMGIPASLEVMQGRGGVAGYRGVIEKPVTTLLSGPAAGVIGGRFEG